MTKSAAGILILLGVLFSLLSCSEPPPIKIGFVGGLTGRYSELGITARNTLRMVVEEVNAQGGIKGRNLELLIRDDFNDPELAEKAINELIDAGVLVIIGPLISNMAEAALTAIEGQNVLMMSPSMSTDYLSGRDDNLLRTTSSSAGQATTLAHRMAERGHSTVAVAYDLGNKKFTEPLFQRFSSEARDNGLKVVFSEAFTSGKDAPISELTKKMTASRADAGLFITSGIDGAALAQQLRKQDSDMQLYGVGWTQTNDLLLHGGKAVEGMQLVGIMDYNKFNENLLRVKNEYIERYNKDPSFIFRMTYDAMVVVIEGMTTAKALNLREIMNAILQQKKFIGLEKDITLDEYGDMVQPYSMVEIVNGEYKNVD